jgi:glc operon protein GlcG
VDQQPAGRLWIREDAQYKVTFREVLMPDVLQQKSISFDGATRVLTEATAEADRLGVPACVAVTDRAGHLVAFGRMDGAPLLSAQIAQDKAYTVSAFGLPTHQWWDLVREEPALLHGIVKTERLIIFGGGVPLTRGDETVGAVGVSGGSSDQDHQIATAGAAALTT